MKYSPTLVVSAVIAVAIDRLEDGIAEEEDGIAEEEDIGIDVCGFTISVEWIIELYT
jgi:hypothetical protein